MTRTLLRRMDTPKSRISPTDPVYAICVGMADFLVPDICRVIMEYLEQIHIDLGRLLWQSQMTILNKEYAKTWVWHNVREGYLRTFKKVSDSSIHIRFRNHRRLSIWADGLASISNFSPRTKLYKQKVAILPENYIHAKLYKNDINENDS